MFCHQGSLELLEKIYQDRKLQHYAAKQNIHLYGDDVLILYRGLVQVQTFHHSGDETILGLLGPMMPISRSFSDLVSSEIYTLSEVYLLRLSWRDIEKSHALALEMNQLLTRRLQQMEILLALRNKKQVDERLLGLLAFLACEFGKETSEGIDIDIRLTHQQIANMVGSTRVTITRCMGALRKANVLRKKKGGHLCVHRNVLSLSGQ
jgi:CRP-like cAMP-binding protein